MRSGNVISFLMILSLFILSGCKDPSKQASLFHYEDNLKHIASEKSEETAWTQEIEKNRLSQKISSIDYVNSSLRLTPRTMIAFESGMNRNAVYPELDGFGSLDISDIDPLAMELVENFCTAYTKDEECEKFMYKDSIFSLVLFMHDSKQFTGNKKELRWLVGKAYVLDNVFEIPVRFSDGKRQMKVNFFLKDDTVNTEKPEYKILDIEIYGVGEINGKQ